MKRLRAVPLLLSLAGCAWAQMGDPGVRRWLDSGPARSFRERVVQLALIYGESSGIDPAGYKVEARTTQPPVQGCAPVEVVTSRAGEPVQRDTVAGCRHDAPR